MATGLISKKYLIDIANAIRVMLESESTYTPAQMATAIANIDGSITGTITKSSNADVGIITDTLLDDICDALRTQLGDNTLSFTPSQIADAILTISSGGGGSVDIVSFSSGTDAQISAMIQAAHNGDIDLQTDGGWAVGDTRTITLGSFVDGKGTTHASQNVDIVITSFDDTYNCGCVLQFDFKTLINDPIRLHHTTSVSWANTEMCTSTLPAIVNALPSYIKDNLITFTTPSYDGSGDVANNKLSLRAHTGIESIDGSTPIAYYSSDSRRIKKTSNNSANRYWLRTWYTASSFYTVSSDGLFRTGGTLAVKVTNENTYVAPFGCL